MGELVDALGIPLADHAKWLPPRAADFPRPPKIVDKEAAYKWKSDFYFKIPLPGCWYCGETIHEQLEVHHMARIGHHDAPWNFALLCSSCHRHGGEAVKADSLPRLLRLKHQYDRAHTSWVHLAIGLGRFLPTE